MRTYILDEVPSFNDEGEKIMVCRLEIYGLSSDTKPKNTDGKTDKILAGSVFVEEDTGLIYIFGEAINDWFTKS